MRLVVLNTHSTLNSGDAAISACQIRLLRDILGDAEITVTSRTPELDRHLYDGLRVRVVPPLFPAPSTFRTSWEKATGVVGGVAALTPKRELVAALRAADLVVGSGGGYLFSTRRTFPGPMFLQAWAQLRLAERLGKPVVFAPQSFGPLGNPTAAHLLRRLVADARVRAVLVREQVSQGVLQGLLGDAGEKVPMRLCPDLAYLAEPGPGPAPAAADEVEALPRPRLAVTVREWLFPGAGRRSRADRREAYLGGVAAACGAFCRRTAGSVVVVPHARGPGALEDDRPISAELHARLGAAVPPDRRALIHSSAVSSPGEVGAILGAADLLLGTRFHSAVLAMTSGVPAVVLGYQPKSVGMMRMMGLERYCMPMDGVDSGRLADLLVELAGSRESIVADAVGPAVAAMRTGAERVMRAVLEPLRVA